MGDQPVQAPHHQLGPTSLLHIMHYTAWTNTKKDVNRETERPSHSGVVGCYWMSGIIYNAIVICRGSVETNCINWTNHTTIAGQYSCLVVTCDGQISFSELCKNNRHVEMRMDMQSLYIDFSASQAAEICVWRKRSCSWIRVRRHENDGQGEWHMYAQINWCMDCDVGRRYSWL